MSSILTSHYEIENEPLSDIKKKKSISPSEIVCFEECSHKWKLTYLDRLSKFETNIDFLFGKAAHDTIQNAFQKRDFSNVKEFFPIFKDYIDKEKNNLKEKDFKKLDELIIDAHGMFDNFEEYFYYAIEQAKIKDFDISKVEDVAIEEKLVEIANDEWLFSGRLDLIFRIDKKYFLWDIKTSKSAWHVDKKNNIAILSQPILYKVFWAKKHNVENLKDISTAFLILKKKGGQHPIDLFRVSSGSIAMERCVKNLNFFTKMIDKRTFFKRFNKFVCRWCEFSGTQHCAGDKGE